VIYEQVKDRLLTLLKAPRRPPEPPAGSSGSVQIFRAAPNFLRYQIVLWGLGFAAAFFLGVILVAAGHGKGGWPELTFGYLTLLLTLVGAVIKYFLIRIDYDMRYYVVTDRSLRIREGALIIHEATFTFANVQNLRILQGPLERVLGLSNLIVETAGGAGGAAKENKQQNPFRRGHEGKLRGVANARQVRDQILVLLKQYRDAGLGDPEEHRLLKVAASPSSGGGGLSPRALERLREVRDEMRRLGREAAP
jgi:membrane protein YdbS with pleckstrin-like domain